jgi:DNA mismatch endonuclease (patch repair protein)
MDNRTPEQRTATMRNVRGKNTSPELFVRKLIHRLGYRFRLHRKDLPGKPDLVFPSRKKAIFVHGCFWHAHGCRIGKPPKSRLDYWVPKLERNKERDGKNIEDMERLGWDTLTIWQCEIKFGEDIGSKIVSFLGKR